MKLFAGYTHAILDGEMDIHRAYMDALGITPEEAETASRHLIIFLYLLYAQGSLRGRAGRGSCSHPFLRIEL